VGWISLCICMILEHLHIGIVAFIGPVSAETGTVELDVPKLELLAVEP
jgi:hypothetical protein